MAGQVWVVLALCGIVGVVPSLAAAEAQMVYNADGSTRLEIINVPGQTPQGRISWQTPDLSQVWIQYPVNQQGRVPWTPAQFQYSVVSDPVKRIIPVQSNPQIFSIDERIKNPNNQDQSSRSDRRFESQVPTLAQSLPNESENEYEYEYDYEYIEEATSENQPITGSNDGETTGPVMDKFPGPEMDKFPGPVMDKFPGPVIEEIALPEMDKFPGPVMDKFPGPVMDKFPGPVMDKFPGPVIDEIALPVMDKFPGPVMDKFPGPVMDKFPGPVIDEIALPVMDKFPGPVMDKFPGPVMDKFPGPVMDKFPGLVIDEIALPEMDKFPGPVMDKFPGPEIDERILPVMDKFPGPVIDEIALPVMDKFPGPVMDKFPGPIMDKFPGPIMDKFPGPVIDEIALPVMDKFPGPVMDKFPGPVMDKFPGPVMDKFPGPVMDKFPGAEVDDFPDTTEHPIETTSARNRFTLPFTTTTYRSVHFTEARVTPLPTIFRGTSRTRTRPMMNKFPGPAESRVTPFPRRFRPTSQRTVMNKFPGPMMNKFPGPEESIVTPTTERTTMNKFPGPMMNKFPGPTDNEEIISVTEPIFEDFISNELDSTNSVETDGQIEDTTELGPVIRHTSRGRPRVFNKPAQKIRPETTKQSAIQKENQPTRQNPNRRPVPQLIVDPSLRQSNRVQSTIRDQSQLISVPLRQNNAAQPPTSVNDENRIRPRRPGIRRSRPGNRLRQGIRRRPVLDNDINVPSVHPTLPREDSARSLVEGDGRGAARSPPRRFRFRNRPTAQ